MNPIETPKEYNSYVEAKAPKSPIVKDCLHAFLIGGLICSIGQFIFEFCTFKGLDQVSANTIVSISLIGISALLTALNIFNKIGKFAGAGSLIPINTMDTIVEHAVSSKPLYLQKSNKICPTEHISPPTQKALKQFLRIGELGDFLST